MDRREFLKFGMTIPAAIAVGLSSTTSAEKVEKETEAVWWEVPFSVGDEYTGQTEFYSALVLTKPNHDFEPDYKEIWHVLAFCVSKPNIGSMILLNIAGDARRVDPTHWEQCTSKTHYDYASVCMDLTQDTIKVTKNTFGDLHNIERIRCT